MLAIKIWLDDERPMPPGFDTHCKTADEALRWLSSGRVTHIDFDHDLGDPGTATGYEVACTIERWANEGWLPPIHWGVHSANPVGRQRIIAAMVGAEKAWDALRWSFETRTKDEIGGES